jgi:hypothetical protein
VLPTFLQILVCKTFAQLCGMRPAANTPASCVCSTQAPALGTDAAVWFEHAAQLCTVLEKYARQADFSQEHGKPRARSRQLVRTLLNYVHLHVTGMT